MELQSYRDRAARLPHVRCRVTVSHSGTQHNRAQRWLFPGFPCLRLLPFATPTRRELAVDVRREDADAAEVAVLLVVVEAVADDELVGDVEAEVLDVDVDAGRLGLAQQRADLDGLR